MKALGNGILKFLLLLSLSVFGIAFLINSTALNPDFVAGQVGKLDMNTIARDFVEEQIGEDMPQEAEFLSEALYDVIADQEPWLKEQLNRAVYAGYDFLLANSDRLEINIPLADLKASVRDSLWKTLQKYLKQDASLIPEDLLVPYLVENFQELASQIPEQLLPAEMTGLTGARLESYLRQHYEEVTDVLQIALQVPVVSAYILNEIQPYFDQYYNDFVDDFPDSQVIDEDEIPADVMEGLETARESIGYFYIGYYSLIAFMVLLVSGIILVNRNIKDSCRALGTVFLVYGIVEFAAVLFARYFDFMKYVHDIPLSMETWLSNLIKDSLLPLQWFSLGILILGAALIAVSIFYKGRTDTE
jgi:hypothetical protein